MLPIGSELCLESKSFIKNRVRLIVVNHSRWSTECRVNNVDTTDGVFVIRGSEKLKIPWKHFIRYILVTGWDQAWTMFSSMFTRGHDLPHLISDYHLFSIFQEVCQFSSLKS
jgi:hypothetical protein